jgi:malonate transporter and related proteins
MTSVVAIVLPIFGLIGIGYAAAKAKLISERAGDGLADYVFALAVPALIFRTLSESGAQLTDSPWGYWASYFAAAAIVWAMGMVAARRMFSRDAREAVVHGFCSAQSNTVFLGIPLILQAYGDAGAVPLFLLLAIHLPLMMTAASLMIEAADAGDDGFRFGSFVKTLATHPILLALFAGVLAQLLGVSAPQAVKPILDGLAASASPVALVAMGLALSRYGFSSDPKAAFVSAVLKLVLHPLLVFIFARYVFSLEPVFTGVAVLFAALPSGINGYLLAVRYRTGERFASNAIATSTALSVITVAGWLIVLGA